jgi:DNA-binding CsgD family transcriptional regulator
MAKRETGTQDSATQNSRGGSVAHTEASSELLRELAAHLRQHRETAESHRTRLMQKLDIHETASLVRYAVRHGIVQP